MKKANSTQEQVLVQRCKGKIRAPGKVNLRKWKTKKLSQKMRMRTTRLTSNKNLLINLVKGGIVAFVMIGH